MTTPRNHSCQTCSHTTDEDIKEIAAEIAETLFHIYAGVVCGEAVLKAAMLSTLVIAQNMNAEAIPFDFDAELATLRTLIAN